jgi:hypothetical protein
MARIVFQADPNFARKRQRFRAVGAERPWLAAGKRTAARVEMAVHFRQFPPITLALAKEFPQKAARIRELRGEYHRASCAGWAGREGHREALLRAAWAVVA